MDKFSLEVKDSKVVGGYDGNSDGENSVSLELDLKEAMGELISKGEAQVDVKTLSLKREGTKVKVLLDTDKDNEPLMVLELDLGEALDEAVS